MSDHDPHRHWVQVRRTFTKLIKTLPKTNYVMDHDPGRHWVQVTGRVPEAKEVSDHIPETHHMRDHDPHRHWVQVRRTFTKLIKTLPQNQLRDGSRSRSPLGSSHRKSSRSQRSERSRSRNPPRERSRSTSPLGSSKKNIPQR